MAEKPTCKASKTCIICGKLASQAQAPFCSKRCADLDLGRWFNGTYRIPTNERPGEAETPWGAETEEDDRTC